MDSPIDDLFEVCPSPYASDAHATLQIELLFSLVDKSYSNYALIVQSHHTERQSYLAVRACSSTGAPDKTAAAMTSPGSLPSITRFGIGENVLEIDIVSVM